MAKRSKKISIEINIRSVTIQNLKDSSRILVLWKTRDGKSIDTKDKLIGPDMPQAVFNEKF